MWSLARSDAERLAMLTAALYQRLAPAPSGAPAATLCPATLCPATLAAHIAAAAPAGQALALHAVARLQASGGAVRVETLAAALGVSRQYLGAQFRHHVGLSPKLFARICRFRAVRAAALATQAGAPGHDWARLATDCGYFDQSHLIRDFHDFSGTSPDVHMGSR